MVRKDKMSSVPNTETRRSFSLQTYFSASVSILTAGPMLQMQWKEAPGDPKWVDLLLDFDDDYYLALSPFIWGSVARRELAFGLGGLDRVLDDIEFRLQDFKLSHNTWMHCLVVTLLQNTIHIWLDPSNVQTPITRKCRAFFTWLVNMVERGKCESWRVRDQVVSLLDLYISRDPSQLFWDRDADEPEANEMPTESLKRLGQDEDMRVRYRAVLAVARLFRHTLNSYVDSFEDSGRQRAAPLYLEVSATDTTTYEKYAFIVLLYYCLTD